MKEKITFTLLMLTTILWSQKQLEPVKIVDSFDTNKVVYFINDEVYISNFVGELFHLKNDNEVRLFVDMLNTSERLFDCLTESNVETYVTSLLLKIGEIEYYFVYSKSFYAIKPQTEYYDYSFLPNEFFLNNKIKLIDILTIYRNKYLNQ